MGKKIIITGATGMIGSLVLENCLKSREVSQVISLVRRGSGIDHEKLYEVIVKDFLNLNKYELHFQSIDVVYYCLGTYTESVDQELFRETTVDYPEILARTLIKKNPDLSFCLLSGSGADRTEQSWISFNKYKGLIENRLSSMGFRSFYTFRPGYIYPVIKRKEPNLAYIIMRYLYMITKPFCSRIAIKSTDLAQVMFQVGLNGCNAEILEHKDIVKLYKNGLNS